MCHSSSVNSIKGKTLLYQCLLVSSICMQVLPLWVTLKHDSLSKRSSNEPGSWLITEDPETIAVEWEKDKLTGEGDR